jgi:DNA polymerase-3 subunit epsilon
LFNPGCDTGPVRVHGIRNVDVRDEAEFSELAGVVGESMAELVLVAHNVGFDAGFLRAEFERSGVEWPGVQQLCTLAWARRLKLGAGGNSLGQLGEFFGITPWKAHNALEDAVAAAALLKVLLAREGGW